MLTDSEFQQTDWETIQTLFVVQGLTANQIRQAPAFKHLTAKQIENRATESGWYDKRERYLDSKCAVLGQSISEQMQRGAESFRSAVSAELEEEMNLYRARPKDRDAQSQKERLDVLARIVNMGEKIYPLEHFGVTNPVTAGYKALTQINLNIGSPVKRLEPVSGTPTLEDDKNKFTGNLALLAGCGEVEFNVIAAHSGQTPEKPAEIMPTRPNDSVSDADAAKAVEVALQYRADEEHRKEQRQAKKAGKKIKNLLPPD